MRRIQGLIILLLLTSLVGCGTDAEPSATDGDAANLIGDWTGSYTCSQGLTGLDLSIERSSSGVVNATFNFYPLPENPSVPTGSFLMEGSYGENGNLILNGTDWLEQPTGYRTVNLEGQVSNNFSTFSGQVTSSTGAAGCTTFSLSKETN